MPSCSAPLVLRLGLLALVLLASGCESGERERAGPELRRYALTGQVVVIAPSIGHLAVRHDRVPGWGEASVTDFAVKDESELKLLRVGDRIAATVFQKGPEYWLGEMRVMRKADGPVDSPMERRAR